MSSGGSELDSSSIVGRPLVPFFIPGSEKQNVSLKVESKKKSANSSSIPIRVFDGGYFSEPKIHKVLPEEKNKKNAKTKKGKTKKESSKKPPDEETQSPIVPPANENRKVRRTKTPITQKSVEKNSKNSIAYANPAFLKSPEPSDIPFPSSNFMAKVQMRREPISILQVDKSILAIGGANVVEAPVTPAPVSGIPISLSQLFIGDRASGMDPAKPLLKPHAITPTRRKP